MLKNIINKNKNAMFAFSWFVTGILFMCLISAANKQQQNQFCTGIETKFKDEEKNHFIDKDKVKELVIQQLPDQRIDTRIKDIDLQSIENFLKQNPYIKNAEVYIDINGKMWVDIQQRTPLLRILNQKGKSYYICNNGEKMPTTAHFAARVPIANGFIYDNGKTDSLIAEPFLKQLYDLSLFIENSPFWKAQTEQIYVKRNQEVILIPKVGNHEIVLGDLNNLPEKFENLFAFYQKALPQAGWERYKTISVKYKNQIVTVGNKNYQD